MINQNYKEIVVVEGEHDKALLKSIYPNLNVMITNGSEVSQEFINTIKELSLDHDIILFLDPDYPGERIRSLIENNVPNVKHAFIKKEKAKDDRKHKVGVEHASKEDIIASLDNLLTPSVNKGSLTISDLYELGFIGSDDSSKLRNALEDKYPIGHTNGKSLLKRLNYLGIKKEELEVLVNELYRNEEKNG